MTISNNSRYLITWSVAFVTNTKRGTHKNKFTQCKVSLKNFLLNQHQQAVETDLFYIVFNVCTFSKILNFHYFLTCSQIIGQGSQC